MKPGPEPGKVAAHDDLLEQPGQLRLRLRVQTGRRAVEDPGGAPLRSNTRSVGTALTSPKARPISGEPFTQAMGAFSSPATLRIPASSDSTEIATTAMRSP